MVLLLGQQQLVQQLEQQSGLRQPLFISQRRFIQLLLRLKLQLIITSLLSSSFLVLQQQLELQLDLQQQ